MRLNRFIKPFKSGLFSKKLTLKFQTSIVRFRIDMDYFITFQSPEQTLILENLYDSCSSTFCSPSISFYQNPVQLKVSRKAPLKVSVVVLFTPFLSFRFPWISCWYCFFEYGSNLTFLQTRQIGNLFLLEQISFASLVFGKKLEISYTKSSTGIDKQVILIYEGRINDSHNWRETLEKFDKLKFIF